MNLFKTMKIAAIGAVVSLAMATAAVAMPISGKANFTGEPISIRTDPNEKVFFNQADFFTATVGFTSTGVFAGEAGNNVIMSNFRLDDVTKRLWKIDSPSNLRFVGMSLISAITTPGSGDLVNIVIDIFGVLKGDGYDDTYGVYSLTGNGVNPNDKSVLGTFSATTTVPLPASVLLLGSGMIGLGAIARRRKKKLEAAA